MTPNSTELQNEQPAPLTADVTKNFEKVIGAITCLTESSHKIAQTGPSTSMLTYGPVMILLAVALKTAPMIRFDIAEFSVLVASGTLLFITSAAIRLYQFKLQSDTDREIRQQAFQTLQTQQASAISNTTVGASNRVQV